MDASFSDPPYTPRAELTAKLGEYYRIETFADYDEGYDTELVYIVAQDGAEQGVYMLDPIEFSPKEPLIVMPAKAPFGLDESKIWIVNSYLYKKDKELTLN